MAMKLEDSKIDEISLDMKVKELKAIDPSCNPV
jgi:hypothetical protein